MATGLLLLYFGHASAVLVIMVLEEVDGEYNTLGS